MSFTSPKSADIVRETEDRLEKECDQILKDIKRIGADGDSCSFGELFDDDSVQNYYEALVGTLKYAKKKKLIDFEGQFLLKGPSDKVVISIL